MRNVAFILLLLCCAAVRSPKQAASPIRLSGAERLSRITPRAGSQPVMLSASTTVAPPPVRSVRLSWVFPKSLETPELLFKLYASQTVSVPVRLWAVKTNVTGSNRSVTIPESFNSEFYVMTSSNWVGESGYSR